MIFILTELEGTRNKWNLSLLIMLFVAIRKHKCPLWVINLLPSCSLLQHILNIASYTAQWAPNEPLLFKHLGMVFYHSIHTWMETSMSSPFLLFYKKSKHCSSKAVFADLHANSKKEALNPTKTTNSSNALNASTKLYMSLPLQFSKNKLRITQESILIHS